MSLIQFLHPFSPAITRAAVGACGGSSQPGAGGMVGVHSKAAAFEGGEEIAFTANGADVAKPQGELRMHAQHVSSGSCEMGKH